MGGDVEEVLRDVGLAEEDTGGQEKNGTPGGKKEEGKVFLHCTVGPKEGEVDKSKDEEEVSCLLPLQTTRRIAEQLSHNDHLSAR